jgi:CHRD domain
MQRSKTLYLVIITGALLSLLLVSTIYSNYVYAQNKFRAKLGGDNQVPPINSTAEGVATFKIKDDTIKSKVNLTGIGDVSGAQILMGKIGQSGDPIVDLLKTGEKTETSDGVAIKANFTASDLEGSMKGKDLSALQSAMAANETYVNIMTSGHPDGEISGHIYAKASTTGTQASTTGTQDITGSSDTKDDNKGVSEEDGDGSGNIDPGDGED